VRNTTKLTAGKKIEGVMLVGRGAGARALRSLKRGTAAHVRWRLQGAPQMAITGNTFLVRDGVVKVVDDREMHPRTAIGIDRETKTLIFLVVDGRQSFSRGYTMVELANKMIELGAEEALNLDGGGSSTMMAKGRSGRLKVINKPSDGGQRSIANGIEITYRKPS
jgi:exopolysaccharide biosynthesis protein